MFKFYFDGTEIQCPLNWDDFEESIVRDDLIKGLLPRYDIKLDFIGDAYNYLYSLKRESGYCNLVSLRVDYSCGSNYETILNGYIPISDCKFNRNKCLVSCQVIDDNFGARIYNNKSIYTDLNAGKSKNGEDITVATEYGVTFFRPSDGIDLPTVRKGVFVYDAFRYLIDFMTDGLVGLESDYLDYTLNTTDVNAKNIMLFLGEELRLPSQEKTANISFKDLFSEIDKKYPLGFTIIKGSDGRPTIKIENADYFYGTNGGVRIENIENLEESFDNEMLYSKVIFGGTTADYNASLHSFGQVQFLGFKEEEYHLTGECNIDKELDLTGDYIVDSNIIEELIYTNTSNTNYDEDTFMVEISTVQLSTPIPIYGTNFITLSLPLYYNPNLANNKVAERYNLQGDIAQYLGGNNVGFRASTTFSYYFANHTNAAAIITTSPIPPQQTSTVKVPFNNDSTLPNYDANNQFNTTTYRYTSTQDGQYLLGSQFTVSADTPSGDPLGLNRVWQVVMRFRRYNSVNTLLEDNTYTIINTTGGGIETQVGSATHLMFLANTDYAEMWVTIISKPKNFLLGSNGQFYIAGEFFTDATVTGGGIYEESEPKDYYVGRLDFERPIDYDTYKTLKADLSQSLTVNHDGINNSYGWIRRIDRNFATGKSKVQLITNLNNS